MSILGHIDWKILTEIMEREGRKRRAPVYILKHFLRSPFQHLIFTVLSSRTRDENTAKVAKKLFSRINKPEDLVTIPEKELEEIIYGVGFHRVKAKRLKKIAEQLIRNFDSKVPDTLDGLLSLEGVGRKTANVVLANAFGKNTIGVDIHVHRISNRLGLLSTRTPEETDKVLATIVPDEYKRHVNRAFVGFGQTVCKPLRPLCHECPLSGYCPKIGVKLKTNGK
jgi:endonuclease-3